MWLYFQSTGGLFHENELVGYGYSGCGEAKNEPDCASQVDKGPIPCGLYTMGESFADLEKGPLVMALTPHLDNKMFNRSGFQIHGDSIATPGQASRGCIILSHNIRLIMSLSLDRELLVIA
jgi:hypothetical protein